ncbi:MAG: bacillithiol biosynthesis BshC, partial [Staphylococcus sp.]|nr:bacillithiol biosynthesis BshC [Staphylococcus sp.]
IETDRENFVRSKASDTFIKKVESLKENHAKIYELLLKEVNDNHDNINLVKKNYDIHNKQFEYLLNRYLLNIERDNDISMKHFREIEHVLHPMGGLQERIWNPLQMMNEFGIDAFSPSTYPPLKYTFNQIVIKP